MNNSNKSNSSPTYRRVQKSNKKVTYRKDGATGKLRFWIGELLDYLKRAIFSKRFLAVFGSLFLTFTLFLGVAILYYTATMPDIAKLAATKEQAGAEIIALDGSVVGRYGQIAGEYIPFDKLPKNLINAVLATEDRRFFEHMGVDFRGILRAVYVNVTSGKMSQGGSSITQQLAKNVFLSPERTFDRKMRELVMAFWLERKFDKKQILAIYLNRVYLGAGNYGVDSAARYYFNQQVSELSIAECAMLAGLLKAPSKYNPTSNYEKTIARTTEVINNMVEAEMITAELAQTEITRLKTGGVIVRKRNFASGRYFADWIYEQLPEYLGDVLTQDVVITTSFNPNIQNALQEAIASQLTPQIIQSQHVSQTSGIVMQPNGAVLAMVGGIDYNKSQYNRATQAKRQAGSVFKLFVYLAAMEHGYNPDDVVVDEPFRVGKWQPKNYKNEYNGAVSLRLAIAKSLNTVAVRLSQYVGIGEVIKVAKRLGVRSPLQNMPSLALGAADVSLKDMVTAYAHLANNGRAVAPFGVLKVVRKTDGKVLYQRSARDNFDDIQVVSPENVAKMNSLLKGVLEFGTAKGAQIGRDAAGKTGTTSDYRDAWFIGYTPQIVVGIWVGNDDNSQMKGVTGGGIPALIWRETMAKSHRELQIINLPTYTPPAPVFAPNPSEDIDNMIENAPKDDDFELQPSFWDKLIGE
jgi:penicillin-binding protein 1A